MVVKVDQLTSGAKTGIAREIVKSVGGNTNKIYMLCDSPGTPINFEVTEWPVHDVNKAQVLIKKSNAEIIIADNGCNDPEVKNYANNLGLETCIPKTKNTVTSDSSFDPYLYKVRHVVENLFAKLKNFRALATRYYKTGFEYASIVLICCILQ